MSKIRRWIDSRRRVVWSEPKLPPYVKINPQAEPDPEITQQPGDLSMRAINEEFLRQEEEETLLPPELIPPTTVAAGVLRRK